jgi:hypothetical protein
MDHRVKPGDDAALVALGAGRQSDLDLQPKLPYALAKRQGRSERSAKRPRDIREESR